MAENAKQLALKSIKHEFVQLDKWPEHWQAFEEWANQAETLLEQTKSNKRKIKSVTKELYYQFRRLDIFWTNNSFGGEYFMLTLIAKHMPVLANIMWEALRAELHSNYFKLDPHYPRTISQYYATQSLPTLWDLVKMQYGDKDWVDLNDFSGRVKSAPALGCFIHAHLDDQGLTLGMYHTTLKILKESALLKRKKEIVDMVQILTSAMEGLAEPSREWIDFCSEAVKPVERAPNDEWFPVAPHLSAIEIDATELKTLDKLVKTLTSKGSSKPLVKAWLEHTKSAKCKEPLSRMINFLMTRAWIVQAYIDASGKYRTNVDRCSGPLFELKYAFKGVIDEALRRKLSFSPEDFDVFVRLLQRLGRYFFPALPLISRCEEYAAQYPLTELQLNLLDRHFDNSNTSVDNDRIIATDRWKKLTARKKRRST